MEGDKNQNTNKKTKIDYQETVNTVKLNKKTYKSKPVSNNDNSNSKFILFQNFF